MERWAFALWMLALVAAARVSLASDADFPQFRGQAGGFVAEQAIPLKWSATENLAWKVAVPGAGWSQPILWQQRLYVTSAVSEEAMRPKSFNDGVKMPQSFGLGGFAKAPDVKLDWQLHCYDAANGQELWTKTIVSGKPKYPVHPSNTYATESPVADADGVYVFFGATGTVAAVSHAGQLRWQQELGAHPSNNGFGTGSSLAIDHSKVFVQHFTKDCGTVFCLDAASGETRWRFERQPFGSSWSSPVVWRNAQRSEVIVAGGEQLDSLDPETGKVLWKLGKVKAPSACSVAFDPQRLYFGGSDPFSKGPLFAMTAGGSGDLTPEKTNGQFKGCLWSVPQAAPGMASPVSDGRCVYVADNNILRCYDAETGARHYQMRFPDMKLVVASLLVIGDKLLIVDEAGTALLVRAGKDFEVIGGGKLDDTFWATPAVGGDSIYLRGVDALHCIRNQ
jgi:outer membrane protein assembly factor BamB